MTNLNPTKRYAKLLRNQKIVYNRQKKGASTTTLSIIISDSFCSWNYMIAFDKSKSIQQIADRIGGRIIKQHCVKVKILDVIPHNENFPR